MPGNCKFESSYHYSGEYTIIKINGIKEKDGNLDLENSNVYNGREYGNFSVNIPIKQEDFVIKNEQPLHYSENGIIILLYKIEKILKPIQFTIDKNKVKF